MLFFLMILLHTPNRALVRAFLSFSSCTKSCFFLVFFVHQVVLFSGFLRAPNRVFFCAFFVHQTVFFFTFLRAPNRAFFRFSSCTKSCFFAVFFVHQMVPYFVPLLQRLGKTQDIDDFPIDTSIYDGFPWLSRPSLMTPRCRGHRKGYRFPRGARLGQCPTLGRPEFWAFGGVDYTLHGHCAAHQHH